MRRQDPLRGRGRDRWITLFDPPANTYSYAMMQELDAAILEPAWTRPSTRSSCAGRRQVLLRGADIKMLTKADPTFKYFFCLHANETLNRLEQTPKVVIAAINGHCVGGGLEVALAADLRVGKRGGGKIGLPEVSLGVLPGTGGTQRLARTLGRAKAFELMATGKTMTMEEAYGLGLVHEVFDAATFDADVLRYAQQFLPPGRAAKAVGLIKRAVVSGLEASFSEGLAIERELQQRLFESEDAKEGLAAYVEKRPPKFQGK
jgi:enoyl-CoA hydratase/carnithine racemase